MKTEDETRDAFAAPQKIVDGLKEAFEGFAKMFEGISEQLESLAEAAEDEEKTLPMTAEMPPDKPAPALSEKKGAVKRPRKTPGRKPKAPAEVEAAEEGEEEPPAPTDEDAPPETEDVGASDDTPDWPPNDTPPWEPPKEEAPAKAEQKVAEPKPTESTITKDDIRSVIVAKIKQKKNVNDKVQSLLSVYGVKALSDLPEDKHEAFLADISQL